MAVQRRGRVIEQAAGVVVFRGQEAGVEVREGGVRVGVGEEAEAEEVRVEGGRRGKSGVLGEAGHRLEDGGEGEGAGAAGRAQGCEVQSDGAAGPALVCRRADGDRPRRVEAAGSERSAHGGAPRVLRGTATPHRRHKFLLTPRYRSERRQRTPLSPLPLPARREMDGLG